MSERVSGELDDRRRPRTRARDASAIPSVVQVASEDGVQRARARLGSPALRGSANTVVRAQALRSVQRTLGNQATREALGRAGGRVMTPVQRVPDPQPSAPVPVQRSDEESWWQRIGNAVSGGAEALARAVGPLPSAQGNAAAAGGALQGGSIYPGMSPLTVGLPIGKVASVDEDPTSRAIMDAAKTVGSGAIDVAKKAGRGMADAEKWVENKIDHPLQTVKDAGSWLWDKFF